MQHDYMTCGLDSPLIIRMVKPSIFWGDGRMILKWILKK